MFFLEFVKLQRDEGMLLTDDEYKRKYPEYTPLSQTEKKRLTRRRKEHKKKQEQPMKCPHGYKFGVDCNEYINECSDCEVWDDCQERQDQY